MSAADESEKLEAEFAVATRYINKGVGWDWHALRVGFLIGKGMPCEEAIDYAPSGRPSLKQAKKASP
jgi:hypothetical protein